jgi:chorismate mutase
MSLAEHRKEVQRIDEEIIELIHDRVKLADDIFESKRSENLELEDPQQAKLVLERAVDLATERNLDAGTIKKIFELLIQMNLQKQHELLDENNLP